MAVMDATQRKKLADALLRKAESLIREMNVQAEANDPARIDSLAETFSSVVGTAGFPPQRATEFRAAVKTLQLTARQFATEAVLGKAELRAREGDEKGRNELLTLAKEHFGKAIRYGANDEFRNAVDRRVQTILLTSKEGVDDRTKQAARRKLEARDQKATAPGGRERRRAVRYSEPTLAVLIDGIRYSTVNWSTRGLLLGPYRGELGIREGDRVRMDITCADAATGGRTAASVVRIFTERNCIAVDFGEISTIILDMMHEMKKKGVIPVPE